MKKILLTLSLLLTIGCFDIIGSNDVFELNDVNLTVTEMEVVYKMGICSADPYWKVSGTAVNVSDTIILAPWYIEAMFYSDSTFSETFGGNDIRMNFSLEPGVISYWTLIHRSESVIETSYPNFKIKDLRAYIIQN